MSTKRTRGRRWIAIRAGVLARDGYACQMCNALSVWLQVDHIVPLAKGGTDAPGNLRALCKACHAAATAQQFGQVEKVTIGRDGWPVEPGGA